MNLKFIHAAGKRKNYTAHLNLPEGKTFKHNNICVRGNFNFICASNRGMPAGLVSSLVEKLEGASLNAARTDYFFSILEAVQKAKNER